MTLVLCLSKSQFVKLKLSLCLESPVVPAPIVASSVIPPGASLSDSHIRSMVEMQVKAAIAAQQGESSVKRGRPYLEEYELVPFPKGFVPPKPAIHANILLSTGPSVATSATMMPFFSVFL